MQPSLQVSHLVQDYYREVEQIEELKRAVQFPKLENLPSDFLTQMEGYVKEAPRPLDEAAVAAKKVPFCATCASKMCLSIIGCNGDAEWRAAPPLQLEARCSGSAWSCAGV